MTIDHSHEISFSSGAIDLVPEPVSSRPPKSAPPPLPLSASQVPPSRAAADNALADEILEHLSSRGEW